MRCRLLFVANVSWFFVSHRLPLAVAAKAAGYDVHVATAFEAGPRGDAEHEIIAAGLHSHRLRFSRSGQKPHELFRDFMDVYRLFRSLRPDIVHLITLKPILLGGLACRLARVPSAVLAIPGRGSVFSATGPLGAARRWAALLLFRLAYRPGRTRVIVQNIEDREYFLTRGIFRPADVALIRGSGVDLERFARRPQPAGMPLVVFAGRMLKEKGVEEFVAAADSLQSRGVDARFVLVGAPDAGNPNSYRREDLEYWVSTGVIEWWGFRPDMESVFAASHIVCLPTSYGEGLPKVLIEAAAIGRAIVTTDRPGCRDVVRNGYNGLLVRAGDREGLVRALARLIDHTEEREAMGERGSQLARDHFGLPHIVNETLEVYGSLDARCQRVIAD